MVWRTFVAVISLSMLSQAKDKILLRQDPLELIAPTTRKDDNQKLCIPIPSGNRGKRQDPLEYFLPAILPYCKESTLDSDAGVHKGQRLKRFVKEPILFLADNYKGPIPSFSGLGAPGAGNPSFVQQLPQQQQRPQQLPQPQQRPQQQQRPSQQQLLQQQQQFQQQGLGLSNRPGQQQPIRRQQTQGFNQGIGQNNFGFGNPSANPQSEQYQIVGNYPQHNDGNFGFGKTGQRVTIQTDRRPDF